MGSNFRRHRTTRELFLQPPGWTTYYTIGHVYAGRLEPVMGLKEISQQLGISHQRLSIELYVALGKLIYGVVHAVGEVPQQ